MKRNKRLYKPILMLISLMLSLSILLPAQVFSAGTDAEVAMEVKAGYNGMARLGAYIPYRIILINKGRAVDGEIQIEIKIDSQNKTVFSKPVALAEGATKEIIIDAPIYTARKGVKVRYQEGKKIIKEMTYNFTKLIPPEMKTIGVLTSDNAAYDFLNGAMIPQMNNEDYMEKVKMMQASGMYSTAVAVDTRTDNNTVKVESVLIPLDSESFPADSRVMEGFDILILSNYDTGTLTQKQTGALNSWLESGGTLVVGTGANWQKVYQPLPEEIKKFSVSGSNSVNPPEELEKFANADFAGNSKLDVVTGEIGFEYLEKKADIDETNEEIADNSGEKTTADKEEKEMQPMFSTDVDEVIAGDDDQLLAVKYMVQSGRILFLTFDPGMEPITSWGGKQAFWENLLFHSGSSNRIYQRGSGYFYSNNNNNYYLNDLAQQVPEDRTPPFLFMFIMIGAYIVIVGPVMYIFLKKKDKRDFSWLAVPAVAFLCLLVIYFAGFKTRYKTAVFNTVSLIHLDSENQQANITTGMGVFNNKKGDLKLTYSNEQQINFDVTQTESRSYTVYADGSEPEGQVVSKIVLTEPTSYELYNVSMWEPKYLTATKSEPYSDQVMNSVKILDGKLRAIINNSTKYDFTEAFITIGTNFIYVGDILSGQERTIEVDFDSENVYRTFEAYLDAQYGRTNYPSNVTPPEDFPEKRRKRIAIERLLQTQYYAIRGQNKIGLYALNEQNLGYDIQINGEEPVSYFTNGIFSSMDLNFEKATEVDIPAGIILPELDQSSLMESIANMDDENGIFVREKGNIDFVYSLPEGMQTKEFSLKFDTYVPLYIKYNMEEMKSRNSNVKTSILQNKYEYYLYNHVTDEWEQIDDVHTRNSDTGNYVDDKYKLKVRVKVVELAEEKMKSMDGYVETERLALPALQLKGVIR